MSLEAPRVFSFPTKTEEIVKIPISKLFDEIVPGDWIGLYEDFESDFLFIPDGSADIVNRLRTKYSHRSKTAVTTRAAARFSQFDQLVDDSQWRIPEREIIDFLWYRTRLEIELIDTGEMGEDYRVLRDRPDSKAICKYLMSQFALDYLTEASPLTRVLPGSYGDLQMAIFKIVSDEYGAGELQNKHSVLFQNTLTSLGMPRELEFYRPYVLNSVYMYMCYVNRIACDKSLFFRFLGFLFVYEACLIYPTQQQGLLLSSVFGGAADTVYFDAHVEIDQNHGVWVVEKMLIPAIKDYGLAAAREIIRGYHETSALLLICDFEMNEAIKHGNTPILSNIT